MQLTEWLKASSSTELSPISRQLADGSLYWDAINTARGFEWYRLIDHATQDVIGSVKTEYRAGAYQYRGRVNALTVSGNHSERTFSSLADAREFVECMASIRTRNGRCTGR